ncbi:hypothetical protein AAEX28_12170 [Lentisphaerota bacterium WC36G]|nr:hypothetical protein LJT99_15000 [Lentisphaerae bacterium WC36]
MTVINELKNEASLFIDMASGSIANHYAYSPFNHLLLDNETVAYTKSETGLIYRYYNV